MRWRNVLSALVVVLLLSCKATTAQLSLSELDSYQHGALLNILDTLSITYYPNILDNRVVGGFAANNGSSHQSNKGSYRIIRHAVLADSAQTNRSLQRRGYNNTTKTPVFTTPQEPTLIAYAFLLLISVLTVVILRFLIKRL